MTLSFFSCFFIIILLFLPIYILYNIGSTKQNRVFSDILCYENKQHLYQRPFISCGSIVSHLCCNIKETASQKAFFYPLAHCQLCCVAIACVARSLCFIGRRQLFFGTIPPSFVTNNLLFGSGYYSKRNKRLC